MVRTHPNLVLGIVAIWLATASAQDPAPVFPGKSWETKTPLETGFDARKLDEQS